MKPLISRYARVHLILAEDPLLKKQLSKKLIVVRHKKNVHEFPPEVVEVTETLHALGADTGSMFKVQIVNAAHDILIRHTQPELPSAVKIKPQKQMEKPIADIIRERVNLLKSRLETLDYETQELRTELTRCETALAALCPEPDPEPEPEPEPELRPPIHTNNRAINARLQKAYEFSRFVLTFLKDGPKSVQEIATAHGIKAKPCYSKLFRLKKKGLLYIDNNIVSKITPENGEY